MITIYKTNFIPENMEKIELNDFFFNKYTADKLDQRAENIVSKIDGSELLLKYTIRSKFDGSILNVDKLSTGCKTVLNVIYNKDKVFDIRECGENAIDLIYTLDEGNVCCDYPIISFDAKEAQVVDSRGKRVIKGYDALKEWWCNED